MPGCGRVDRQLRPREATPVSSESVLFGFGHEAIEFFEPVEDHIDS